MEKGQSELTEKIRSAIKKKLIEINAFVDDELPDYIMILVANKRSKAHMEKDLTLFLGKDTAEFTNWLWELVNNLKVISKAKQNEKASKSEDETTKRNHSDEDADVLDYDLGEQEGDFEQDESNLDCQPMLTKSVEVSKPITVSSANAMSENVNCEKVSPKVKVYPMQAVATVHPSPMLKSALLKANLKEPDFTGNVSSVVRVSQKNHARPSLQANKLLLRAVDDATKSVLDGKSINDFYKPTPLKLLSYEEVSDSSRFFSSLNSKVSTSLNLNSELNIKYVKPSNFGNESNVLKNEPNVLSEMRQSNRTIRLLTSETDLNLDSQPSFVEETPDSPHFIVTLDGVDFPSFKRKFSECSDENMEVDEEGPLSTGVNVIDTGLVKKQKIVERCKYWPACKNSNNCTYHHPAIPCRSFPDCKYGDKCLYIHPNCKFDSLCTRKDCPFTHASKRTFKAQPVPLKVRKPKVTCKFYPKCTVRNCPFIHPKLCRYGAKCRFPTCTYSHLNIPLRSQLKWKANALN